SPDESTEMLGGNAGKPRSVDRAYGYCKQDCLSLTLSVASRRTRPRIGMLATAVVSGHGGAAHAGARRISARSTAALVISTLWPFLASGCAWAIASAPAWPATAADRDIPLRKCSTSVRRHGIGATPPNTTLAVRMQSPSTCSTTATLTSAWVQASRSVIFR